MSERVADACTTQDEESNVTIDQYKFTWKIHSNQLRQNIETALSTGTGTVSVAPNTLSAVASSCRADFDGEIVSDTRSTKNCTVDICIGNDERPEHDIL